MNKKAFILFAAVPLALLFSCSGDSIQSENTLPIETAAKLCITAQDATTGNALSSVSVTLQSTGETKSTQQNGDAVFEGVQAGLHQYIASLEGRDVKYAPMRGETRIGSGSGGGVFIAQDNFAIIQLYPLTAGLEGYLYYDSTGGKKVPMPGMPIRVEILVDGLITKTYEEPTGPDGKYTFSNLPAVGSAYNLYALGKTTEEGVIYNAISLGSGSINKPLLKDAVSKNSTKNYSDWASIGSVFILTEYTKRLAYDQTDAPLSFKFSEKIDMGSIKTGTIYVSQAANISYGESGNEIIITPATKWTSSTYDPYIYVEFTQLKSISGKFIDEDYTVELRGADLSEDVVTGLVVVNPETIRYGTRYVDLRWNKLEGANVYEVYVREEDSTSYKRVTCSPNVGKEYVTANCRVTTTSSYSTGNDGAIKDKISTFVVRAKNSSSQSKMWGADSIPVSYQALPGFIDGSPIAIYEDCENWGGSCNDGWLRAIPRHKKSTGTPADSSVYFFDFNYCSSIDYWNSWEDYYVSSYDGKGSISPSDFNNCLDYDLSGKLKNPAGGEEVSYGRIFFNRPMDMATLPAKIKCIDTRTTGDACKKLDLKAGWSDESNLTRDMNLNLTVKTTGEAVPAAGPVDVVFSIEGLKGKNGEKFTTKYNGTVSNNIRIRFTANIAAPCAPGDYSPACIDETCTEEMGPLGSPNLSCSGWCSSNIYNSTLDIPNCDNKCNNSKYWNISSCPFQVCSNPGYGVNYNDCDNEGFGFQYCSAYGAGDYANCPTQYCNANGTTDSGNCPIQYCNANGPSDPFCDARCSTADGDGVECNAWCDIQLDEALDAGDTSSDIPSNCYNFGS